MYNLANQITIYNATHTTNFWDGCTFPADEHITLAHLIEQIECDHGDAIPVWDRSDATHHYVVMFFDEHYYDFARMLAVYNRTYQPGETTTRSKSTERESSGTSEATQGSTATTKNAAFDSGAFTNHDQREVSGSDSTSASSEGSESVSETVNKIKGVEDADEVMAFYGRGIYKKISALFADELLLTVY